MRHRVQGRKLGRTSAHRKALFRNQLSALFTHERIITTVAKAKELRPLAERMVTLARTGTLPARRKVLSMVPDKEIVARLFDDIAPRFMDRAGGYTRIMRLGRRHGDGAEIAIIEFVDYVPTVKGDESGEPKRSLMDRAKGMFGGGAAAAETAEEAVEAAPAEQAEEAEEAKPKKKAAKKTTAKAAKAEEVVEEAKPKKKAAKKTTTKAAKPVAEPAPAQKAEAPAEDEKKDEKKDE